MKITELEIKNEYIVYFSVTYLIPKVAKHLVINSSLKCVSVKEKLNYGKYKSTPQKCFFDRVFCQEYDVRIV